MPVAGAVGVGVPSGLSVGVGDGVEVLLIVGDRIWLTEADGDGVPVSDSVGVGVLNGVPVLEAVGDGVEELELAGTPDTLGVDVVEAEAGGEGVGARDAEAFELGEDATERVSDGVKEAAAPEAERLMEAFAVDIAVRVKDDVVDTDTHTASAVRLQGVTTPAGQEEQGKQADAEGLE